MDAEAQRQFEQFVVDMRAVVELSSSTLERSLFARRRLAYPNDTRAEVRYLDRAPGLFADRQTTGRELVLAMLTERVRRGTLTVLHVSADQATFEVRLRCGLVVCITPATQAP
jgi:hypothetical protein